jgi:hypothetical protein
MYFLIYPCAVGSSKEGRKEDQQKEVKPTSRKKKWEEGTIRKEISGRK